MDWQSVYSSHVDKIAYDEGSQQLYVVWQSGKTSVYDGVPSNVADEVRKSPSIGSALRETIKGLYSHRYL